MFKKCKCFLNYDDLKDTNLHHYGALLTLYSAAICTIRVLTILLFIYQNLYLSASVNSYI